MAAVITYEFASGATTTPPTATQAFNENSLAANVTFLDADTIALITHNWGMTTTQLATLQPWADFYPSAVGTATIYVQMSLALTTSVSVGLVKTTTGAGTGVGWTWVVILQRPHSMIT